MCPAKAYTLAMSTVSVSSAHEIITPKTTSFWGVSVMDKITHQGRAEHWTRILNECMNSGMFKTAWCQVFIV